MGYEILRSKVALNYETTDGYIINGQTFLNSNFINLYPHIGYRFSLKKVSLDVVGGFDLNDCLKAIEKGSAISTNGIKYTTSVDRKLLMQILGREYNFQQIIIK